MKSKITEISTVGYEKVIRYEAAEIGLKGFIAVHSTKLGPGMGGVRMRPYRSDEEALTDVLRLAKAMSYKAAAAGLPLGGGKCVVFGDPFKDKTDEKFIELGKVIDFLKGKYLSAENSGTSVKEMQLIHRSTKHVTGITSQGDPSPVTALGVFQGIGTALEVLLGIRRLDGVRIAVQGVGNVGFPLARQLHECGAKLVVCDAHPEMADRARRQFNAAVVDPKNIFDQEVEVFAPCAYGGALNKDSIPRLRCKIVAGAANNQFLDEEADPARLHARGIWHAPDYVINAGGIINLYCEWKNLYAQLTQFMAIIPKRLREVFALSQKNGQAPFLVANALAEKILK